MTPPAVVATELRAMMAALVFFSRLPVPQRPLLEEADLRRAATWWPLVGLLVGAAMLGAWWLAASAWPPAIAVGLALAAGVLVTGALEQDGTADVADGFAAGPQRESMLAAMKDPLVGPAGVLAVLGLLGLRWQALLAMPGALLPAALLTAQVASRSLAVGLMALLPYLRGPGSRAAVVVGRLSPARLAVVALTGLAPLLLLPPATGLAALLAGGAVLLACTAVFGWRLGGCTGDCVGATQQVGELALLLAVLAAA